MSDLDPELSAKINAILGIVGDYPPLPTREEVISDAVLGAIHDIEAQYPQHSVDLNKARELIDQLSSSATPSNEGNENPADQETGLNFPLAPDDGNPYGLSPDVHIVDRLITHELGEINQQMRELEEQGFGPRPWIELTDTGKDLLDKAKHIWDKFSGSQGNQ